MKYETLSSSSNVVRGLNDKGPFLKVWTVESPFTIAPKTDPVLVNPPSPKKVRPKLMCKESLSYGILVLDMFVHGSQV